MTPRRRSPQPRRLVNSDVEPVTLRTRGELADFFRDLGYTGRFDGDEAEFQRIRAIRPRLRSCSPPTEMPQPRS